MCGNKTKTGRRVHLLRGNSVKCPARFLPGHHSRKMFSSDRSEPFELNGELCRRIPLTFGLYAIVSAHRYEYLMQWKWCACWNKSGRCYYAVRALPRVDGKKRSISMHRFILGIERGRKITGDHIRAKETLNNADHNLRLASKRDQQHNKGLQRNNTSGYKGVTYFKPAKMYRAQISLLGKSITVGYRKLAEDAAHLYDLAAIKHYGDFASLNFLKETYSAATAKEQSGEFGSVLFRS